MSSAMNEQDFALALEKSELLERQLRRFGLESGWLTWSMAVIHDMLGHLELAFDQIGKAVTMDPFNPTVQRSHDIIAGKVRARLASADPKDEVIPRLYRQLQQSGDVDVSCHLVMARHLAVTEQAVKAAALLEAVTLTAPASVDAWRARAVVARQLGKDQEAAECEAEAMARGSSLVPFGLRVQGGRS